MLACTMASVGLVALLAAPWLPLPVLYVILFTVVLLEPPFRSARAALLVDVLPGDGDRYTLGSTVNLLTSQGAQVLGFGAGGALIAVVGPRPALLIDAATFAAAALLIRLTSPRRPAAAPAGSDTGRPGDTWGTRMRTGVRVVFGDPWLRQLVILAWLVAFWVVPEGLAVPYAHTLAGAAGTVGLLLAAQPAGTALGALVLTRFVAPHRRRKLLVPLAGAPLLLCALQPPLPVVLAALAASGFGNSYQVIAQAAFMQAVPDRHRAQSFGLVSTGLAAGQGLGLLAGGITAEHLGPPLTVAAAGTLGLAVVLVIGLRGTDQPDQRPSA